MDIINLLVEDHRRVFRLFEQCDRLETPAAHDELLVTLVQELSLHETAEEQVVWPLLREAAAYAVDLGPLVVQEQSLTELLEDLVIGLGKEDMRPWLGRVRTLVAAHVHDEETLAFPLLQQHLDHALRERAGRDYLAAKAVETSRMAGLNVIMAPDMPVVPAE